MKRVQQIKDGEAGLVLLEFLLALPVLAVILAGIALGVTAAAKNYLAFRAQQEVQQEVQQSLVRVMDDCLAASRLSRGNTNESIKIYDEKGRAKQYFVNEDRKRVRKLVENRPEQPMTGNHAWAMVAVTSFGISEVDPVGRPGLYKIWLEAESQRVKGARYRLATEVYLPPERGGGTT